MSQPLVPMTFPLHGARLIEASAGTGKTWTIAALYVRLVLGHGGADGFSRPLMPAEILVMTFTRAATRELSDRIRARLVEAAACFRGQAPQGDDVFLQELLADYPDAVQRGQAAHRLTMAAEAMDECAIFTIDAWCQRMLREHAFDSGSLFEEELVRSEEELRDHAVRDYWRMHVYALDARQFGMARACWSGMDALAKAAPSLLRHADKFSHRDETLGAMMAHAESACQEAAALLKPVWAARLDRMQTWIADNRDALDGRSLRKDTLAKFFTALREWVNDASAIQPPENFSKFCAKLHPAHIQQCYKNGGTVSLPEEFGLLEGLQEELAKIEPVEHAILRHAACHIARRIAHLKRRARRFGFADMLARLKAALEGGNGATLARRITTQYPVALIDEFQDTSADQYRIFNLLYRVTDNAPDLGIFLIGDPKQAIYGFRGADIHSYLHARRATAGRHYMLDTNYRSTAGVVAAVNHLFLHAEGGEGKAGHARGAFRFKTSCDNPLPFKPVAANGRRERLVSDGGDVAALTLWCHGGDLKKDDYLTHFGALCAEQIATLLNDPQAGFTSENAFQRLEPADVAVLVRDRFEAAAVRRALRLRGVDSVYLSDKDSVFKTVQAADLLLWLRAIANPLQGSVARAAFATATACLALPDLASHATDDAAWEGRVQQLKDWRGVWQRAGVLAMLRRVIHDLGAAAKLLATSDGERALTNVLHLAELLQQASQGLDGEQALIRWLADQIDGDTTGDERVLRLESDAELVQVITVHKSKGLEYPLVFLPYAVSARKAKKDQPFFAYADADGIQQIDFSLSDEALKAVNAARMEEDLRLLYVALTRARHALWLGVTSIEDAIHESAFGYLLTGGAAVPAGALLPALQAMCGSCDHIQVEEADATPSRTRLIGSGAISLKAAAPGYTGAIERTWRIASYSSITRGVGAMPVAVTPLMEMLDDDENAAREEATQDQPWHRFPRGALPGQFLHDQLEWMASEGFARTVQGEHFVERLQARCDRAGREKHQDDVVAWMQAATTTPLPPLGIALCGLPRALPEMEFWFPTHGLSTTALDDLCSTHLLDQRPRPPLMERALHGMLHGFKDLVFAHGGRYWIMDYKSTYLGGSDAAYHAQALLEGMAEARYDVQGTIYLVALHRLLQSRMGAAYDPAQHLGGAVFFFLRGIGNGDTRGCYHLNPPAALLQAVDRLLPASNLLGEAA